MGFYEDRERLSGDTGNPWTEQSRFDPDISTGEVDAAQFSFDDFSGPVDQSTVSGDQGPLGGSTPGGNPLA